MMTETREEDAECRRDLIDALIIYKFAPQQAAWGCPTHSAVEARHYRKQLEQRDIRSLRAEARSNFAEWQDWTIYAKSLSDRFSSSESDIDVDEWVAKPFWSTSEIPVVLLGKNPKIVLKELITQSHGHLVSEYYKIEDQVSRAKITGELRALSSPIEVLQWAANAGLHVPERLKKAVEAYEERLTGAPSTNVALPNAQALDQTQVFEEHGPNEGALKMALALVLGESLVKEHRLGESGWLLKNVASLTEASGVSVHHTTVQKILLKALALKRVKAGLTPNRAAALEIQLRTGKMPTTRNE